MYCYYLLLEQKGSGCDYTIGCGLKCISLHGDTLDAAKKDAEQYFDGENYSYGRRDRELCDAMIVRFEADAMPILNAKLMAEEAERAKETYRRQEIQERAELERLQRKYQ
jgi:hypothetical protein